jgi:hypothetical protein
MLRNSPKTTHGCTPTRSIRFSASQPHSRSGKSFQPKQSKPLTGNWLRSVGFRLSAFIDVYRRPNLLPPISPPVYALKKLASFRQFPHDGPTFLPLAAELSVLHKPKMPRSSPKTPQSCTPARSSTKSPRLPAEPSRSLRKTIPTITIKTTYKKLASFRQFPA